MKKNFHQPVLLNEVLKFLDVKKGRKYIDSTVGGAGHAQAIIQKGGQLLGIDCDPEAVQASKERLQKVCPAPLGAPRRNVEVSSLRGPNALWKITLGNFSKLDEIAKRERFEKVHGILFDLGVSSHQLETAKRGFSFQNEGPLDMRLDPAFSVTAADLVNALSRKELYALFTRLGEEKRARTIADALVRARCLKKIETTTELADIIVDVYGGRKKIHHLHPATKVFQALRIAVNDELNNLKSGLFQAERLLKKQGRLVVISFHGLEDRIVKNFFKEENQAGRLGIMTKKPTTPSQKEVLENPRSRSAKLRAAFKI